MIGLRLFWIGLWFIFFIGLDLNTPTRVREYWNLVIGLVRFSLALQFLNPRIELIIIGFGLVGTQTQKKFGSIRIFRFIKLSRTIEYPYDIGPYTIH